MFLIVVEYLSLYTYLSSIKYSNYRCDPKLNNAGIENGWLDGWISLTHHVAF